MNTNNVLQLEEVLNIPISYFQSFSADAEHRPLKDIFAEIKGGSLSQQTKKLKELFDAKNYKLYQEKKRNLPAVTFSGIFERKRNLDSLLHYSYLCVLDIDKLGECLEKVSNELRNDDHVFALWKSPSQEGLKGLVILKYSFKIETIGVSEGHKLGFEQLRNYFKKKHNVELDPKGSDIPRLCFLSQDKSISIKCKITPFEVRMVESPSGKNLEPSVRVGNSKSFKDKLYNPEKKNVPEDREAIRKIIKFLEKNKLSITYEYDQWLKVGFAIAGSFTYDVGRKYYHSLSCLDKDKYEENECERMLKNCYKLSKNKFSFSTIMRFAKDKGFDFKRGVKLDVWKRPLREW